MRVRGRGGGNNVVWKMLKMLLRWRCRYVEVVEDVATLKMLKMLLHIEGVITLKTLLRWRCRTEQRLQNGAVDLRLKKKDAHFVHAYLEDNAFFTWSIRELKLYQHAILQGLYEINFRWRTWQRRKFVFPAPTKSNYVGDEMNSFSVLQLPWTP